MGASGTDEIVSASRGSSASMVSGSGSGARGEQRDEVREVRMRVWCVRCELSAVWAVISL